MRLSFEDEANEEIACGRKYTPFPRRSWRVAGTAKLVVVAVRQASRLSVATSLPDVPGVTNTITVQKSGLVSVDELGWCHFASVRGP
jgi:hypothetical protein